MYSFDYQRPTTISETIKHLQSGSQAKPLAGGMSIVPIMRHRLSDPSVLVDLADIADLKKIEVSGAGRITIGAMANHYTVSRSELIAKSISRLSAIGRRYRRPYGAQSRHDRRLARS